jgi:hypothetical protein
MIRYVSEKVSGKLDMDMDMEGIIAWDEMICVLYNAGKKERKLKRRQVTER